MTRSQKYTPGHLNSSYRLKFPEEAVYHAPGLGDIILKMTGSLKYRPGIIYFSSLIKFPEEAV